MTDMHRGHVHHGHHHAVHEGQATVKDPVCGMTVDPDRTEHHVDYKGETFHFCSARCHDKFVAAPEQYLKPEAKPAAPEQAPPQKGVIYTCPMHPEIRQEGPGTCPICGMALEPVTAAVESGPNPELVDMTRRFWIGLALSLPLLVLEMGSHIPALGLHDLVPPRVSVWVQFLLATPVVLWAGWPLLERGWRRRSARALEARAPARAAPVR